MSAEEPSRTRLPWGFIVLWSFIFAFGGNMVERAFSLSGFNTGWSEVGKLTFSLISWIVGGLIIARYVTKDKL